MMGNKNPQCTCASSTLSLVASTPKSGESSRHLEVPSTLDPSTLRPLKDALGIPVGNGINKPLTTHCNGVAYSDDDIIEEVDEAEGADGEVPAGPASDANGEWIWN